MESYSSNDRAGKVMGLRPDGVPIDCPVELGYHCPVCNDPDEGGNTLHWSEYNGFLWCARCDIDIPSPMCVPLHNVRPDRASFENAGIGDAVDVFLNVVTQAAHRVAVGDVVADRNTETWYVIVNDLIGGWSIGTMDSPLSDYDLRPNSDSGAVVIADFCRYADAMQVCIDHNTKVPQ